jgi:hypothetical protein
MARFARHDVARQSTQDMETVMSKLINLGRVSEETKTKYLSLEVNDGGQIPPTKCDKFVGGVKVANDIIVDVSNTHPSEAASPYELRDCFQF